jgi:hypothetical protein
LFTAAFYRVCVFEAGMKILLIIITVLLFLCAVFFFLWRLSAQKNKKTKYLYDEACKRNIALNEQIGKMKAGEILKSEVRKNADKKIGGMYGGDNRSRFDAANNLMRDN